MARYNGNPHRENYTSRQKKSPPKSHEECEAEVAEFKARGGKVEKLPPAGKAGRVRMW